MGQQGLGLRKAQLELVLQKHLQPPFDFLGFTAWPDEADQPVIGIAQVAQTPVSRVGWVKRRKLLHLATMLLGLLPLSRSPEAARSREASMHRLDSFFVGGHACRLEAVRFRQTCRVCPGSYWQARG